MQKVRESGRIYDDVSRGGWRRARDRHGLAFRDFWNQRAADLRGSGSAVKIEDAEDPDRALVEQAQAELPYGTSAYNEIVRKYTSRVYGRSYGILRSSPDAEEAVQDVFLAVFRTLPRYRFERPFLHWLNTVTLNACRMILRKRASEQRRRQAAEEKAPPPERPLPPDVALRTLLLELLDQLDPGTRVPLLLRYV